MHFNINLPDNSDENIEAFENIAKQHGVIVSRWKNNDGTLYTIDFEKYLDFEQSKLEVKRYL